MAEENPGVMNQLGDLRRRGDEAGENFVGKLWQMLMGQGAGPENQGTSRFFQGAMGAILAGIVNPQTRHGFGDFLKLALAGGTTANLDHENGGTSTGFMNGLGIDILSGDGKSGWFKTAILTVAMPLMLTFFGGLLKETLGRFFPQMFGAETPSSKILSPRLAIPEPQ